MLCQVDFLKYWDWIFIVFNVYYARHRRLEQMLKMSDNWLFIAGMVVEMVWTWPRVRPRELIILLIKMKRLLRTWYTNRMILLKAALPGIIGGVKVVVVAIVVVAIVMVVGTVVGICVVVIVVGKGVAILW